MYILQTVIVCSFFPFGNGFSADCTIDMGRCFAYKICMDAKLCDTPLSTNSLIYVPAILP